MTASEKAKDIGFKSLKEVQEISKRSQQYLDKCSKERPLFFSIILEGCLIKRFNTLTDGEQSES